jgi:isocitrate/isopropylmalate dehydrogenase
MTRAAYTIVALPGDGAGAEVTAEALKVLAEVGRRTDTHFAVEEIPCGGQYFLAHGRDWPEGSEEKCAKADVILLGAVGWPSPTGPAR